MDHTNSSICYIQDRAGAPIRQWLVTILIGDKGVFKVSGCWDGDRDSASALLLIPGFLQLLKFYPAATDQVTKQHCIGIVCTFQLMLTARQASFVREIYCAALQLSVMLNGPWLEHEQKHLLALQGCCS